MGVQGLFALHTELTTKSSMESNQDYNKNHYTEEDH